MNPLLFFISIIPTTACVALSGYMALKGIPAWGWFLFVGLLLGGIAGGLKP
ncbi:hypothetical protein [Agrobacterium rubi]|uniref:hypothetical protein n=1 Tax=Agrobacterium rubi TaxID=28099 RepID=UPI001573AFE4|nr:hypothetical protein [Agrobacterium rubi]NTE87256.1 hypothetical protein [Agrobacterium rubi]NTF03190.1 hypothetical protein [Agrobacterium rubi]